MSGAKPDDNSAGEEDDGKGREVLLWWIPRPRLRLEGAPSVRLNGGFRRCKPFGFEEVNDGGSRPPLIDGWSHRGFAGSRRSGGEDRRCLGRLLRCLLGGQVAGSPE